MCILTLRKSLFLTKFYTDETIPVLNGKNSSVIDLPGCADGIYTLRLVSSDSVVNKKIILQ
ncbi:MAG: hypothetical protein HYU69_06995 [Bacteroidetes bacterium]|nr:hypothetical protein [Bacteroidota bacterium]